MEHTYAHMRSHTHPDEKPHKQYSEIKQSVTLFLTLNIVCVHEDFRQINWSWNAQNLLDKGFFD